MDKDELERYFKSNQEMWDRYAAIHVTSKFYDVEGFKKGRNSLTFIEREELGDVSGKSLLHLQCHFGLDTLAWARLGAKVTGVDFSEKAIMLARALAQEISIHTYLNVMAQYHPAHKAFNVSQLSHAVRKGEFDEAIDLARKQGLDRLDKPYFPLRFILR